MFLKVLLEALKLLLNRLFLLLLLFDDAINHFLSGILGRLTLNLFHYIIEILNLVLTVDLASFAAYCGQIKRFL